ncbi:MAG: (d)CMP kinase [Chthoniobacterales bacterium]|jgi:cytidylate kinase|nr:(d)CMP kinase [Chthoniobacterales bacterium]
MTNSAGPNRRVIAIDGPAASGKSSVARALATRLGFVSVNSGAMYRAITWHVLDRGLQPHDREGIARLVETTNLATNLHEGEWRILIEGADPLPHLRTLRVNEAVSSVSSIPRVREILVAKMRACARDYDVVVEGRDIGSVVFPRTPYKYYVDASPEIRAQRRAAQGQRDQIAVRDHADSSRSDSPLTVAGGAWVIDSSSLPIEAVVDEILRRLRAQSFFGPAAKSSRITRAAR